MRSKRLLAAVLDGIAAPMVAFDPHHFSRPSGTDLERLRGDAQRVGSDFKKVISREHGNRKALSRSDTPAKASF